MSIASIQRRASQMMPWFLVLYAGMSLIHFTHNAEHLAQYPNLPTSWTRVDVYLAWCCVTALGLLGYMLYRGGYSFASLTVLTIYGFLGLAGLLHYTRAPFSEHSRAMNLTICAEAVAATMFLITLACTATLRSERHAKPAA